MNRIITTVLSLFLLVSCEQEFLSVKPSSNIIRPQTLEDLERLLDNSDVINVNGVLQRLASDEYYIPTLEIWESLPWATQRNAYLWKDDVYEGETNIRDWDDLYRAVFYANNVLEELERIGGDDKKRLDDIRGRALFVRAYALYDLLNTFAPFYDPQTSNTDLGIPLRLAADVNHIEKRATIKDCYVMIIGDLERAGELLAAEQPPQLRTRQSKTAAYALLARIYLNMADYGQAEEYASRSLALYDGVTDFNTLDKESEQPFQNDDTDVLYYSTQIQAYNTTTGVSSIIGRFMGIDEELIGLYDNSDLRLQVFFGRNDEGRYYRKNMFGSRISTLMPFTGLATDEMYLIKSESEARNGKSESAKQTLIQLLEKRFTHGHVIDLEGLDQDGLIDRILEERCKELVWRSLRWNDLKRLNREGRGIVLHRSLGSHGYSLEPNSSRYIFPIPDNELIYLK